MSSFKLHFGAFYAKLLIFQHAENPFLITSKTFWGFLIFLYFKETFYFCSFVNVDIC